MTGHVLSDKDIEMLMEIDRDGLCWEWPSQREDLIATIFELRDRLNLAAGGFDNMVVTLQYTDEENVILREALDRIDYLSNYYAAKLSCHMDKDTMEPLKLDPIAQEFADIVRETLAKVGEVK